MVESDAFVNEAPKTSEYLKVAEYGSEIGNFKSAATTLRIGHPCH
jgi:hypothetical protein